MASSNKTKDKTSKRNRFSLKDKYKHYKAIAKGEGEVKKDSKYSEKEQRAYARGQVVAREELYRIAKSKAEKENDIDYIASKRYREHMASKFNLSKEMLSKDINETYRKMKKDKNYREELRREYIEGYADNADKK